MHWQGRDLPVNEMNLRSFSLSTANHCKFEQDRLELDRFGLGATPCQKEQQCRQMVCASPSDVASRPLSGESGPGPADGAGAPDSKRRAGFRILCPFVCRGSETTRGVGPHEPSAALQLRLHPRLGGGDLPDETFLASV